MINFYYRFINGAAIILAPLHKHLIRKKKKPNNLLSRRPKQKRLSRKAKND